MEIAHDDHAPNAMSSMCLIQPHTYFETEFGSPSCGFDNHQEHSSSEKSTKTKVATMSSSSSLSSPGSTKYGSHEEGHSSSSVISFKSGSYDHNFAQAASAATVGGGGSLLSFDQNDDQRIFSQDYNSFSRMMILSNSPVDHHDDSSIWEDNNSHYNYQNQMLLQSSNNNIINASPTSEVTLGWLSSKPNLDHATMNSIQVLGRPDPTLLSKRPYNGGESPQASKKQCTAEVTKMPKSKSKDPQSIAAKNRRERISERLKILQDLVPNGSKVDLVTMLEKAISYVKFLQLQVKVLATDEFWPAQGGKAPDLSQVREAIDAILASQRDRNSTSHS